MKKYLITVVVLTILFVVSAIVLSILGNIKRTGYIEILNINDSALTQNDEYAYDIRIRYYDKVFKNSDIYDAYLTLQNLPEYIKYIELGHDSGSYGMLIATKELNTGENITDIEYRLKIKKENIYIVVLLLIMMYGLFLSFRILRRIKLTPTFVKPQQIFSKKTYALIYIVILLFSISVRLYYASKQKDIYWDEYFSLVCIFNQDLYNGRGEKLYEPMKKENNTIKEYIKDIKALYKDTSDPYITNLYYSLLRTSLIFRTSYTIPEIIILGTILNVLFFIISFIFLEKLLSLLFIDDTIKLFSLLCTSLMPSSITLAMFLRPYQMQETFFIVMIYMTIHIWVSNKFNLKYFLILSVLCSLGYLVLYSSIIFVLAVSIFVLFLYFLENDLKENLKKLIFFASSFLSAFFIASIFYTRFLISLFTANDRAGNSFKLPTNILGFINYLCFVDMLFPILLVAVLYFIYRAIKKEKIFFDFKMLLLLLIAITGILYSLYADITSPSNYPRYSQVSFPLIFLILPLFLTLINEKKIKISIICIISLIYLYNISTPKNFDYYEDKENFYSSDNLLYEHNSMPIFMYGIGGHFNYHNNSILGGTAERTYKKHKNYDELKERITKEKPDKFFVINNLDLTLDMNDNFIKASEGYSNTRKAYNNRYIFEFVKIEDK